MLLSRQKSFYSWSEWVSEVTQSCPTLCDPIDYSPQGSSVHGIFKARVLEWVAISFSRGSSRLRDQTQISRVAGRHFTVWATREAKKKKKLFLNLFSNWRLWHTAENSTWFRLKNYFPSKPSLSVTASMNTNQSQQAKYIHSFIEWTLCATHC